MKYDMLYDMLCETLNWTDSVKLKKINLKWEFHYVLYPGLKLTLIEHEIHYDLR